MPSCLAQPWWKAATQPQPCWQVLPSCKAYITSQQPVPAAIWPLILSLCHDDQMHGRHADGRSTLQLSLTAVAISAPLILPSTAAGLVTAGSGCFSCCLRWDGSCELVSSSVRCAPPVVMHCRSTPQNACMIGWLACRQAHKTVHLTAQGSCIGGVLTQPRRPSLVRWVNKSLNMAKAAKSPTEQLMAVGCLSMEVPNPTGGSGNTSCLLLR